MDPIVFGDPTHAKYVIAVSHAWLTPLHADPDGAHLDLMIGYEDEWLKTRGREEIGLSWPVPVWEWWWRYYYMYAEGDIVFFFDMASLPQKPRTAQEQKDFKDALGFMHFLYHSFHVFAITYIPDNVRYFGHRFSYLDRGWCWAEATVAQMGGKLARFSPSLIQELDKEEEQRKRHSLSLRGALCGYPEYPEEILQGGNEHLLIEFRRSQSVQGKFFTNGRFDIKHVARILVTIECKQRLQAHLQAGDLLEVEKIFDDEEFFTPWQSGMTKKDLANTVFDDYFNTPLHLSVIAGSKELVEFLVENGARPRRNFEGSLPWERWGLFPRFSAAATAARTLPPGSMGPTKSWLERWSWSARREPLMRPFDSERVGTRTTIHTIQSDLGSQVAEAEL